MPFFQSCFIRCFDNGVREHCPTPIGVRFKKKNMGLECHNRSTLSKQLSKESAILIKRMHLFTLSQDQLMLDLAVSVPYCCETAVVTLL